MTCRIDETTLTCLDHPTSKLVMFCPAGRGSVSTESKKVSAQANGKKGGRPRKTEPKAKP